MRYTVLIRACAPGYQVSVPDLELTSDRAYYAISVTSNPALAVENLQNFCPLPCELIHAIHSDARTDYLERTLHIKYEPYRLRPKSFWFALPDEAVKFIQSLNERNFYQIAGFINKAAIPAPPPVIPAAELPDFIRDNLELAESLLNGK